MLWKKTLAMSNKRMHLLLRIIPVVQVSNQLHFSLDFLVQDPSNYKGESEPEEDGGGEDEEEEEEEDGRDDIVGNQEAGKVVGSASRDLLRVLPRIRRSFHKILYFSFFIFFYE